MRYNCPRCGKTVELSDDELASQHNAIVCPACLMEFQGRLRQYAVPESGREEQRYYYGVAPTQGNAWPDTEHCRFCGAQISKGCTFCPVCGNRLVGTAPAQPRQQAPRRPAQQAPAQAPAPQPRQPQMPYMPSYRYASYDGRQRGKQKASWWAYALMAVLVAVFVGLVFA